MFNAISSTSPRVFISTPRAKASFHLIPVNRADIAVPPSLPAVARPMMAKQTNQLVTSFNRPTRVRNPLKAKNNGSRNRELKFPNRSKTYSRKPLRRGITTPARNAPNKACMPIASVASADAVMKIRTAVSVARPGSPSFVRSVPNQPGSCGRRTHTMIATNKTRRARHAAVEAKPLARATATTNARIAHAVASLTAAQPMAVIPRKLLVMRRSSRMRASTGKAVMLNAIPMNSPKGTNETSLLA